MSLKATYAWFQPVWLWGKEGAEERETGTKYSRHLLSAYFALINVG